MPIEALAGHTDGFGFLIDRAARFSVPVSPTRLIAHKARLARCAEVGEHLRCFSLGQARTSFSFTALAPSLVSCAISRDP